MTLLNLHRSLLSDRLGQEAFRRAIHRAVFPGAVVLDLGTGTGIHALFACEAGARRVYAVEREAVIELARLVACANGCDDRITFLHASLDEVTLAEPVDVIIGHHGLEDLIELLAKAKRRFLKANGRVVPVAVELFAAPAESPAAHGEMVGFWQDHFGYDFSPIREVAANTVHAWRLEPDELLGEGVPLDAFALADARETGLSVERRVQIARLGTLHGIGTWAVLRLIDDVVLSTAPPSDLPAGVWRDDFFPLRDPVSVRPGDTVTFSLRTGPGGWGRIWQWTIEVHGGDGRVRSRASHSSFAGELVSAEALHRQSADYVPALTPHGAALRFVLDCLDGRHATGQIEQDVRQRFPDLFPSPDDAAVFVTRALARHAR